jgi:deoxyribodipyrimidine photo-lyase
VTHGRAAHATADAVSPYDNGFPSVPIYGDTSPHFLRGRLSAFAVSMSRRSCVTGIQSRVIDSARVKFLNDEDVARGRFVLYWMQASQRAAFNPALEYAIGRANELKQPVVVGFGLMDNYPEANARHYQFMLEGLREVKGMLRERGIAMVVRKGSPADVANGLAKEASLVVCDRGYLRYQRRWRDAVADDAGRQVVEVEGDIVIPVETASNKAEFAARTIRPKIQRLLTRFLKPLGSVEPTKKSLRLDIAGNVDLQDPAATVAKMKVDHGVGASPLLVGGYGAARGLLELFVQEKLRGYGEGRREPSVRGTSMLAAYLHFGQISPVEIALAVQQSAAPSADREAFLDELIVRRELAMNFAYFHPRYDEYEGLPDWARKTLAAHAGEERADVYTTAELEEARTHDAYWNAAQNEMLRTGFMHNSMRMYWGKKILEWKKSPQEAFADALYLNNKYFLCGRDPASYANVGWLFGLHDRPWATRKIFGTVRYMNAGGLKRKFDMDAYVQMVAGLTTPGKPKISRRESARG